MSETPQKQPRLLIVDDSSTMRRIIRFSLAKVGFDQVTEASGGIEAIKIILSAPDPQTPLFDCILTDWNMPDLDGLNMLKRIRENPAYAKVPFIMITTEQSQEDVIFAMKNGFNAYIVKPFLPETLKSKIQGLLK